LCRSGLHVVSEWLVLVWGHGMVGPCRKVGGFEFVSSLRVECTVHRSMVGVGRFG
jgi:hypothetical protein